MQAVELVDVDGHDIVAVRQLVQLLKPALVVVVAHLPTVSLSMSAAVPHIAQALEKRAKLGTVLGNEVVDVPVRRLLGRSTARQSCLTFAAKPQANLFDMVCTTLATSVSDRRASADGFSDTRLWLCARVPSRDGTAVHTSGEMMAGLRNRSRKKPPMSDTICSRGVFGKRETTSRWMVLKIHRSP